MPATVQQDPNNPRTLHIHLRCDVCNGFQTNTSGAAVPGPGGILPEIEILQRAQRALEEEGWIWSRDSEPVVCPPCHANTIVLPADLPTTIQVNPNTTLTTLDRPLRLVIAAVRAGRQPPPVAREILRYGHLLQGRLGSPLPELFASHLTELAGYLARFETFRGAGDFLTDGIRQGDIVRVSDTTNGHLDGDYEVTGPSTARLLGSTVEREVATPEVDSTVFVELMEVLQPELHDQRPVYLHPWAVTNVRRFGRDVVELQTNPELLKRGLYLHILGFPVYSMPAIPNGKIYLPPSTWVPKRSPDDGLLHPVQKLDSAWLYPKPARTRWERMLGDDLD